MSRPNHDGISPRRRGQRHLHLHLHLHPQQAKMARISLACLLAFTLCACASGPPAKPEDACAIFVEKRAWYKAAHKTAERWSVPESVLLAFVKQESSFRAKAKPPRQGRFLWIFPGPRPSSAYGYAQALDGTWADYQAATGHGWAERDDFADAVDFIGWYIERVHERLGIAKDDAYRLYLAYHEGPGGYVRGSHQRKPWLLKVARRVEQQAHRYAAQYAGCRAGLSRPWFIRWFD